jgi:hypothetical protein
MSYRRLPVVVLLCLAAGLALSAQRLDAAGNSATSPDTNGSVGQSTSITLDSLGNPVVSYYDNTNTALKVLHCSNADCSGAQTSQSPDTNGIVGQYTSIALDGSGHPVVAYYDSTNHALKVLHCDDPNCAGNESGNTTTPDTNTVGTQTSLVLDGSGKPAVSYYAGHLKVLRCGNATCSSGNTTADPDIAGPVGFYSEISIATGDLPVVSYYDQKNADLKILRCGNPTCTSGNLITTPDMSGDVGQYTSSVQDPTTGFPVVSYYDATNGDLKVLHCGSNDCSASNIIATPDTAGDVGSHTSLVLDGSRKPVVSYRDTTNGDLKILHCGNTTCTSGNLIAPADTIGNVGFETSIALDGNTPIVSYYDQTNQNLKVLRCGGANCKGIGIGDSDGDGCSDVKEQQTAPGSQLSGGVRDYLNPWDYFNPTHDHLNRVDDILAVVNAYFHDDVDGNPGLPPYPSGYNPDTDRALPIGAPHVWSLQAPNGMERVDDILNIVKQYFHDCS